jgi:glutamate synthase (NADPH/NADH) large chain
MLTRHVEHTGSEPGKDILTNWEDYLPRFVKVIPVEYKRALAELRLEEMDRQLESIREEEQLEVLSDG